MEMINTAGAQSTSPFSALSTMFYEPTRTFESLENKPSAWLPVVVMIAVSLAVMMWYFSMVDIAWLSEQMFAKVKDVAQREKMVSMMSRQTQMMMVSGGIVIGTPIILAILGVYFMIVGKVMSKQFSFGKGFALAAWSMLVPSLIGSVLVVIQILMSSNGQIAMQELNPLTLNQLVFHYEMGHPLAGVLDAFSVGNIWTMFLLATGLSVWAKVSKTAAWTAVLIPFVTITGIWLAIALMSAPK